MPTDTSKNPPILTVRAHSPFHEYYVGEADVVSAENAVGPFDILPEHTAFFSLLTTGTVTITSAGNVTDFQITNGIISVRHNQIEIFVNI